MIFHLQINVQMLSINMRLFILLLIKYNNKLSIKYNYQFVINQSPNWAIIKQNGTNWTQNLSVYKPLTRFNRHFIKCWENFF